MSNVCYYEPMISYQNRHEISLDIPLRDGKKIHAILRGKLNSTTPIVVMMHGRPGSASELLQYLGAHYISEHAITTLRLSMYDFGPMYRSILDCTLDTHAADFEDVITYLRGEGAGDIFALGHSYGGITILRSKAKLNGAILWDPSHGLAWHNNNPEFNNPTFPKRISGDIAIGIGGRGYIYSKTQDDQDAALGDTTEWARGKEYPMKFILASAGPLAKYAKRYYDVATEPKALVEMTDAHHQFEDNDDVTERLFAETVDWIERLRS
jgi:pimeloyl-ACP methyl ester carboxylesterase